MKINRYILYIIVLFFLSCKKNTFNFNNTLVKYICKESIELPSSYDGVALFGRCDNSKVTLIYLQDLKFIHSNTYKNIEFSVFLSEFLNQEIQLGINDKIKCFNIDKTIQTQYDTMDFKSFLNTYTSYNNDNRTLIVSPESIQFNSILYYLFINYHIAYFDDYTGKYYIRNLNAN